MKKLFNQSKNTGVIPITLQPEEYEQFKKNLMTALKKFSSSRKTRAVHKLINNNSVISGIFSGDSALSLVANLIHNNEIKHVILNLAMYDDSLAGSGTVTLASRIIDYEQQIQKEETFVNEKRLLNIEKLQEKRKEVVEKFLKSIDYIKAIDGIYFGWLLVLATKAIDNESKTKAKIVTLASDILANILKKMYTQVRNTKIESDVHQLIEAIAIYFIKIYFYGESGSYALNSLKKAFSEDTIDAIKRARVTQFKEFNDLAKILKETELMPITENVFESLMKRYFGKYAYEEYIQKSLVDYCAFMANLAYNTQLFRDSYPVDDESHRRLEELLLNEQKNIKIRKIEV